MNTLIKHIARLIGLAVAAFIIYVCVFALIGKVVVPAFSWDGVSSCRERVIPQIPIYPDAQLISATVYDDNEKYGHIERLYKTSDGSNDIIEFHNQYGYCVTSETGDVLCRNKADPNFHYSVTLNVRDYNYSYKLDFSWQCGLD